MAKYKKLPKKPKKPKLNSSLEVIQRYKDRIKEWQKKCNEVNAYNNKLKKAREDLRKL